MSPGAEPARPRPAKRDPPAEPGADRARNGRVLTKSRMQELREAGIVRPSGGATGARPAGESGSAAEWRNQSPLLRCEQWPTPGRPPPGGHGWRSRSPDARRPDARRESGSATARGRLPQGVPADAEILGKVASRGSSLLGVSRPSRIISLILLIAVSVSDTPTTSSRSSKPCCWRPTARPPTPGGLVVMGHAVIGHSVI